MARARLETGLMAGLALLLVTQAGCPKDPYDADTWIDKLDDPHEAKAAVDQLASLKDPKSIPALGKAWRKHAHPSAVLRVIMDIAEHPKNKDGKDTGQPVWKDAIPILEEAVAGFELGDPRSIEDAMAAADALGRAGDPDAVKVLIDAVNKSVAGKPLLVTDPAQNVRIAAMRALGKFGSNDAAVTTLVTVLQTDPLDETNRDNPDAQKWSLLIRAAAANGLGSSHNQKALEPLLEAMFSVEAIFPQVRSALTRFGQPAVPELIKVFKGEHQGVNALAKKFNFASDCTKGEGPGTQCVAPGALAYKSAIVLGDLRAKEAVPVMVEALKKPARTSFFSPQGVPGPPDHNGILDALRKIGDPSVADTILMVAQDPKVDDVFERPIALDVYSMLTRDTKGLDFLTKTIKSPEVEDSVLQAAALAYARLVRTKDQLSTIDYMIDTYTKKAKDSFAASLTAKKQEDKDKAEGKANDYRDFALLFLQHKVRAMVGVKCGDDVNCYLTMLKASPDIVMQQLNVPAPLKLKQDDADKWKKEQSESFQLAAEERSLLEIAKLGSKASAALPDLLRLAESPDGLVRDGVLLAMVQVAKRPCDECVKRLDEVISSQEGNDRLSRLVGDTRVVRDYLAGAAGGASAP